MTCRVGETESRIYCKLLTGVEEIMKRVSLPLILILAGLMAISGLDSLAQTKQEPSTDEIIRRFAKAESENKIARNNYVFTQDVDVMTLSDAGSVTGRFKRVSDIVYDDLGNRVEKITNFPPSTLQVGFTKEDIEDLSGVQPFALTTEDLPKYDVKYAGKERIDELNLYIFDVKPKQMKKGERYFLGRIWVDDEDLQIVKTQGKGVPETDNNKYPKFESFRENIDGKYWFPTYVYADDILEFKSGGVRLKMIVKYTNYKKFSTDIRVVDEGDVATEDDLKEADKKKPEDKAKPAATDPKDKKEDAKKKNEKKPPDNN
jgi:hypothetical protein